MNGELMGIVLLAIVVTSTLSVLAEIHGGSDDVR